MNWKTLGKAFLITVGVFAASFLLILILALLPTWLSLVIGIACITWLVYHSLTKNNYDTDNDRMSWFSNREEEEDDDEETKED